MFGFTPAYLVVTACLVCANLISSFVLTFVSIKLATKLGVLDKKDSAPDRKDQKSAVPLLGATGFVISSLFFSGLVWLFRKNFFVDFVVDPEIEIRLARFGFELGKNLSPFRLLWVFVGAFIILIGGFLDDKFQFKSKVVFIPTFIALLVTVWLGDLRISSFSYPFDGFLLDSVFAQHLLAFVWIGACLTATKFLDGHDGLVATVGIISLITIAVIATLPNVMQPFIVLLAILWAAGIAGFLPWNLPDARVYLGEGGSQIIGFVIGVFSILSGAKIATASTVLGWFIFDIIFVFALRILSKKSPFEGDRLHWNFRLLDAGMTKSQVLFFTAVILIISAIFGVILDTNDKLYLIAGQGIFLLVLFVITSLIKKHREQVKNKN
jgi:UDP-GlcNAc:undecaprenyl-phosphate GlcNAc-1-phosphate transferase